MNVEEQFHQEQKEIKDTFPYSFAATALTNEEKSNLSSVLGIPAVANLLITCAFMFSEKINKIDATLLQGFTAFRNSEYHVYILMLHEQGLFRRKGTTYYLEERVRHAIFTTFTPEDQKKHWDNVALWLTNFTHNVGMRRWIFFPYLHVMESNAPDQHSALYAEVLRQIARGYSDIEQPRAALVYLKRALVIEETIARVRGPRKEQGLTLRLLGIACMELRKVKEALSYNGKAWHIYVGIYGRDHYETSLCLSIHANIYNALGRYKDAKNLLNSALHIQNQHHLNVFKTNNQLSIITTAAELSNTWQLLGTMCAAEEKYDYAKDCFLKALQLREGICGKKHIHVDAIIFKLADVYGKVGPSKKQRDCLVRSLEFREAQYGPMSPKLIEVLVSLNKMYSSFQQQEKADRYLQRALAIQEKHNIPNAADARLSAYPGAFVHAMVRHAAPNGLECNESNTAKQNFR